jgi:hypothetical protein
MRPQPPGTPGPVQACDGVALRLIQHSVFGIPKLLKLRTNKVSEVTVQWTAVAKQRDSVEQEGLSTAIRQTVVTI